MHVETVVLLSQQKPDDTIEIDLDLDDLDATSAELKATYQEIKDYVLKEFAQSFGLFWPGFLNGSSDI